MLYMSHLTTKPTKWLCAHQRLRSAWASAQSKCSCWRKSMQEKESIMVVRCELKIPSLWITVQHHSASLRMPTVTLMTEFSIWTSQPLISDFAVRMKKAWVLSYPLSQSEDWLDWVDAQADLSLQWAQSHFVGFVMRRSIYSRHGRNNTLASFCHWADWFETYLAIHLHRQVFHEMAHLPTLYQEY